MIRAIKECSGIVTYPTGVRYRRWLFKNATGSLRIEVEQFVGLKPGSQQPIFRESIGDVSVSGSVIPKGATGLICHESLPVKTFHVKGYANEASVRRHGFACARKWFKQLAGGVA